MKDWISQRVKDGFIYKKRPTNPDSGYDGTLRLERQPDGDYKHAPLEIEGLKPYLPAEEPKIDLGWATSRTLYTRQDYIDAAFDASVFVETVDVTTHPLHAGVVRVQVRGLNGFTTDALLGRVYEYLSAWAPLNVQIEVNLLELSSERRDRYSENWDRLTAALARKNVILDQTGRDALGRRPRSNGIGGFGP